MKPENIVLTEVAGEPDFVKVLDFGIAKMAVPGSGQSAVTRQGLVMGTPAYMAPEQARAQTVGPAADLYSLGVVLYHCLSGRVPFDGDTPLAVMMKHGVDPVPPLVVDGFPPDVPPALERLVLALLSKRPEDRPGPALDVARLLEASLWDRTVRFGTPDAVEQATAALPAAPSAMPSSASPVPAPHWPTGASDEARGPRRWPWLVMAGVVLIAVLAWLAWPSTPVPPAGTKAEAAAAPDTAVAVPVAVPAPAPNPGPPAAADVRTQPDPAPVPAPAEDAGPPAAVTRRLPACKALKCPFTAACIGPDGRRTKGEDWCMPVFK
jgi:serine/threonine-protein kinase